MEPQKSIVLPVALSVLVSAVVFGGLGYYLASNKSIDNTTVKPTYTAQTTVTSTSTPIAIATPTSTTTSNSIVNKTYSDDKGSYSVELPENHIASKSGGCEGGCSYFANIHKKVSDVTYTDVKASIEASTEAGDKPTLAKWIEDWKKRDQLPPTNCTDPLNCLKEVGNTTIGGVTAKKFTQQGMDKTTHYLFVKDSYVYKVSLDESTPKEVEDAILKTFKFTK